MHQANDAHAPSADTGPGMRACLFDLDAVPLLERFEVNR
jgi:hypothetical protein